MNTFWISAAIQLLKLLRWYVGRMTPEEKAEWKRQIREMPSIDEIYGNDGMGGQ